ncbi:hypothetical protein GCM10027037_03420 [Mucilaginibacter koreensis]
MTQNQFVQYLHDNDCSLTENFDGASYKCKRRNYKQTPQVQAILPKVDWEDEVIDYFVCHVCYHLKVEVPAEYRDICNDIEEYE